MRYASFFSGIGGIELGIQYAHENTKSDSEQQPVGEESEQEERTPGGVRTTNFDAKELRTSDRTAPLCVGYSEIDKYAIEIYQRHFPNHRNYGDITRIDPTTIPDIDLVVGGFPCQAFSIAGKRLGFADTRGTLFFDIARILKEKRPRLFLLENVKGLLSHDNGRTFKTIIATLDELGYDIQWQVLNSKNHGVPQNRERIFIIGHSRGTPRPKIFPFRGTDAEDSESRQVATTINAGGGGQGAKTGLYAFRQPLRYLNRNQKNIEGDYAFTVDASQTSGIRQDMKIRRLTPTECERLQGFPDGWTEGISDTQRYKCLGNAVTVNVIQDIMEILLKS